MGDRGKGAQRDIISVVFLLFRFCWLLEPSLAHFLQCVEEDEFEVSKKYFK